MQGKPPSAPFNYLLFGRLLLLWWWWKYKKMRSWSIDFLPHFLRVAHAKCIIIIICANGGQMMMMMGRDGGGTTSFHSFRHSPHSHFLSHLACPSLSFTNIRLFKLFSPFLMRMADCMLLLMMHRRRSCTLCCAPPNGWWTNLIVSGTGGAN